MPPITGAAALSTQTKPVGERLLTDPDEPITILLVDDDEDCRTLIRDAISECKVSNETHECRNGQETLRRIRSDPAYRDIPVVMMTGVSDEQQMRTAAANGANSYTIKPASAEQFLRTVLASTNYWLTIHQYPSHRLPQEQCRR